MFEFSISGIDFEWSGSHTVNVYFHPADPRCGGEGFNTDCFSLNYGRDDYTKAEVMAHTLEWMEYANVG